MLTFAAYIAFGWLWGQFLGIISLFLY